MTKTDFMPVRPYWLPKGHTPATNTRPAHLAELERRIERLEAQFRPASNRGESTMPVRPYWA